MTALAFVLGLLVGGSLGMLALALCLSMGSIDDMDPNGMEH